MILLLQLPIRCCDKPAAGGLAPQIFDVLHEYASDSPGSARRSHDFGDNWQHEIELEAIVERVPKKKYPLCADGARAYPPEDCGGVPGYEDFLRIMSDPTDEEHETSRRRKNKQTLPPPLTPYHGAGCIVEAEVYMTTELKIGQLAKQVGVNIETIRYYERLNLLGPTSRLPSGYRLYNHDSQRRLLFIKNAQALGFTLREIEELLELRVRSTARCGDVQKKAEAKLKHVEAKVRDLQSLAMALRSLVRACRAGQPTDHCPMLQALEQKGGRGNNGNRKTMR